MLGGQNRTLCDDPPNRFVGRKAISDDARGRTWPGCPIESIDLDSQEFALLTENARGQRQQLPVGVGHTDRSCRCLAEERRQLIR